MPYSDLGEHYFYNMCMEDNKIILKISQSEMKIPHITCQDLTNILFKQLKLNKACDIYMLTVEHLRYAGEQTLFLILKLLNRMIDNVNCLSEPELNTAIATIVHKSKGKSLYNHKSYRLVRVTPLLLRLFDEYVRPMFITLTLPHQNPNQYGYTKGVNYLLAALQRHEVEKFCIDQKKTLFTCSHDRISAFDLINRQIQTRELYCSKVNLGTTGELVVISMKIQ